MTNKFALIAALALLAGCGKDDSAPSTFELRVTPKHHGRSIDSCTIYVKYNALQPPANGVYDDSARCVPLNGVPVATFAKLPRGNHYLYGYGWDPALTPPKAVKGGYPYPDDESAQQSVELAVSEDH